MLKTKPEKLSEETVRFSVYLKYFSRTNLTTCRNSNTTYTTKLKEDGVFAV
jgi:hypothetical protein